MSGGRNDVRKRKEELRALVTRWAAEGEASAVALSALGEVTAEAAVALCGRSVAKELMAELARSIDTQS